MRRHEFYSSDQQTDRMRLKPTFVGHPLGLKNSFSNMKKMLDIFGELANMCLEGDKATTRD